MLKKVKRTPKRVVALLLVAMMLFGAVPIVGSSQFNASAETGGNNGLRITGIDEQVTYGGSGKTFTLGTEGGKGDGDVTFTLRDKDPDGVASIVGIELTINSVGSFVIVATKGACAAYGEQKAELTVTVKKELTIEVEILDRYVVFNYEGDICDVAEIESANLVGIDLDDEGYVYLVEPLPTAIFMYSEEGENIGIMFKDDFAITGPKSGNYTLTQPEPGSVTATIMRGLEPEEDVHYTLTLRNPDGWTEMGADFVIEAKGDYLVSLARTESGAWVDPNAYLGNGAWQNKIVFPAGTYGTSGENIIFFVRKGSDGATSGGIPVEYKIDNTRPEITQFEFTRIRTEPIYRFLNFLTFGLFFNEEIQVTVTASDAEPSSGLSAIQLYTSPDRVDCYQAELVSYNLEDPANGTAVFKLPIGFKGSVYAVVTDNVGNESDLIPADQYSSADLKDDFIQIENILPTIVSVYDPEMYEDAPPEMYEDDDGRAWYPDDIQFKITVRDEDSGIRSVEVKINDKIIDEDINEEAINANFSATQIHKRYIVINTSQGIQNEDGSYHIEVTVVDNAGNQAIYERVVYKDTTIPVITEFDFTRTTNGLLQRVLNFLTFGLFFNEEIRVTVTASDAEPSSGLAAIQLIADPAGGGNQVTIVSSNLTDSADGTAVFRLPVGFRGIVSAVVTDNVGNQSAQTAATTLNSNLEYAFIQIENIAPTIDIAYAPAVFTDSEGGAWYPNDIQFAITASDVYTGILANSGIFSVEVRINDTIIPSDINGKAINANFFDNQTHEEVFVINTSQGTHIDGRFRIDVAVVDNAGNSSSTYRVVYRDIDIPVITGFEFSPVGIQEADGRNTTVEVTDYGFYFRENTTVTISASDAAPSAGIRSITYYTICVDNGRSAEQTVSVTNDQISFVIPADFKGQIYARATDNVNHAPADFVNPNSAIIASPARHAAEGDIVFTRPATPFTDNAGLELYATDVNVGVGVVETFAGLRSVEWSVISPNDTGNNQSGTVNVSNIGALSGDTAGWSINNRDRNLVTEMSTTLTVRNDSNNIAVWVRITDRAGNTSEETIRFSIDKTAPTIDVTYDNNSPDSVHTNHFNADRVATIVITERNFRAQDVNISITNTGGPVPSVSSWATAANTANPDATTHTATITFSADGVYTFGISYSDNAGNAATPYGRDDFTIDQTDPVISVSFDNNSAESINHFDAGRIATISITERNFDERRVVITGTATYAGAPIVFPALGEWSSDGDVRTAAINFGTDGLYAFGVAFTDMAGNTADAYAVSEFYIDISPPALVENHNTAHHEAVSVHNLPAEEDSPSPFVFDDTNISHIMYTIIAQTYVEGEEHGGITIFEMGDIEVFANRRAEGYTVSLPSEFFNANGTYEIRATAFDLAGNNSGETVHTYVVMREIDMMAYIPSETLAIFNGIHKQAVNFPDIIIHIFVIDNKEFELSIGEVRLISGDYEEETVERANGIVEHIITIPNSFIARTFYSDDQVYILPINVTKNPMRTIGYIIINNVPPSGIFDPALGLRSGIGFYGIDEQEIRVINLSDGIDEGTTTVTVNGVSVPFGLDADAGTITFTLERSSAYGHPWAGHNIRATLIDTAGNEFTLEELTNVYVGNWFMRYWIFFAIGGVLLIGGGGLAVSLWLRRKKNMAD